jgi:hypothetical protein
MDARLTRRRMEAPSPMDAMVAELAGSSMVLLPRSQRLIADRPIIGAVLRTRNLAQVAALARRAGIDAVRPVKGDGYRGLVLPPAATHGIWLEFRQVNAVQD